MRTGDRATRRTVRDGRGGMVGLAAAVAAEAVARARRAGRPVVHARAVPVDPRVGDVWFRWLTGARALAWVFAAPGGDRAVGVGAAGRWTSAGPDALGAMASAWRTLAQDPALPRAVRLGGGWAFAPEAAPDGPWAGFPAVGFVLPALMLECRAGRWTLVAAVRARPEEAASVVAARLAAAWRPRARPGEPRRVVGARFVPPASAFTAAVRDAVAAIAAGRLAKVVLARSVELAFDGPLAAHAVWRSLAALYPDAYRFGVWYGDAAFLGATPEVLVRTEGGRVETMSLAGTAPADRPPSVLRASVKDREEHAVVRDAVVASLGTVTAGGVAVGAPRVVGGRFVQHLLTPVAGRLAAGRTIWDAAAALHPTPAVGGAPAAEAGAWIRTHEGWPRGWYAGAVGTVDLAGDGFLVVALRSALVRGAAATLFAGAGVVARSVPERELEETSWKMLPMLTALAAATAPGRGPGSTRIRATRRRWAGGSKRWWRGWWPEARTER